MFLFLFHTVPLIRKLWRNIYPENKQNSLETHAHSSTRMKYKKNKNIPNASKRQTAHVKCPLSLRHCDWRNDSWDKRDAYDVEDVIGASRVRSRARECNGMFTAAEHDALIIKGHGYCTDMSATRQEPARENAVIYKPGKRLHIPSVQFSFSNIIRTKLLFLIQIKKKK